MLVELCRSLCRSLCRMDLKMCLSFRIFEVRLLTDCYFSFSYTSIHFVEKVIGCFIFFLCPCRTTCSALNRCVVHPAFLRRAPNGRSCDGPQTRLTLSQRKHTHWLELKFISTETETQRTRICCKLGVRTLWISSLLQMMWRSLSTYTQLAGQIIFTRVAPLKTHFCATVTAHLFCRNCCSTGCRWCNFLDTICSPVFDGQQFVRSPCVERRL